MPRLNRRQFLARSAAIGAGTLILTQGYSHRAYAANDKIAIAQIGLGGRGQGVGREFARRDDVDMTWVCDPDDERAGSFPEQIERMKGHRPKRTRDMREIFADKGVDAVVVSTCDHWHALATIWACQAGKDVYVEKPASNNVWEGRKMVEAARKYGRVVQVGMQNRSAPYVIAARKYIDEGNLGDVRYVKVFNMKNGDPYHAPPDTAAPSTVNYGLYLGPAPERAFNRGHFHDGWKCYWAYSGGDMCDDGVHQMDIARYLINRDYPRSVSGVCGNYAFKDDREVPDSQALTYDFGDLILTFELTQWAPYMRKTTMEERETDIFPRWDTNATRIELYGTKQRMIMGRHGDGWQAIDVSGNVVAEQQGKMGDPEHRQDFVDRIRDRGVPNADIEEGHRSALMCHLGNLVGRVGNRRLEFDASTEGIVGDAEAQVLLRREYRKPFEVPEKV